MQKRGSVTIEVEDARQINQLCSLLHVTLLLFLVKKTGKAKLKRIKKNRKRTYVVSGLVYGNYGYSVSCFEGTQTSVCWLQASKFYLCFPFSLALVVFLPFYYNIMSHWSLIPGIAVMSTHWWCTPCWYHGYRSEIKMNSKILRFFSIGNWNSLINSF